MKKKHFSISVDPSIIPVIDMCACADNRSRSAEIEYTLKRYYKNFAVDEKDNVKNEGITND